MGVFSRNFRRNQVTLHSNGYYDDDEPSGGLGISSVRLAL